MFKFCQVDANVFTPCWYTVTHGSGKLLTHTVLIPALCRWAIAAQVTGMASMHAALAQADNCSRAQVEASRICWPVQTAAAYDQKVRTQLARATQHGSVVDIDDELARFNREASTQAGHHAQRIEMSQRAWAEPTGQPSVTGYSQQSPKTIKDAYGIFRCEQVSLAKQPTGLGSRPIAFLHFCLGKQHPGDLGHCIRRDFSRRGLATPVVVACGPAAGSGNLFYRNEFEKLLSDVEQGLFQGAGGGPPCSTVSKVRHQEMRTKKGQLAPRPLRSRSKPLQALEGLSPKETRQCDEGTVIFLRFLWLITAAGKRGAWVFMEHPADPGYEPYPSFFNCEPMEEAKLEIGGFNTRLDQCRYGCLHTKPTQMLLRDGENLRSPLHGSRHPLSLQCNHGHNHPPAIGRKANGGFVTTALARYPEQLCESIAECFATVMKAVTLASNDTARMPYQCNTSGWRPDWADSDELNWVKQWETDYSQGALHLQQ